ncbi:hypothetical protein [Nocardia jiangsuensis]|uniref:Excreted virulence factor EspC (Type VII ESX diderm) n=1 Tax=Nocardia jiangsuensis TaxID=1691563 RepID=A0ABV8DX09_9NOCA
MTDEVGVSIAAMRLAVRSWQEAAVSVGEGVGTTSKLEIAATHAGTFAEALGKYQPAPGYFRDRLSEGVTVLEDIAEVLNAACNAHEAEERASTGQLTKLESEI